VHLLPSAWAGYDPPIPVGSLARFTALRSLYLRRADQNSMRTTALPLPTGLRRALLIKPSARFPCCCWIGGVEV